MKLFSPITISGMIVHGRGKGTQAGFPTANLRLFPGFSLPPSGVYAAFAWINGEKYQGVTNVGTRPTVDSCPDETIETLLFDFTGDIYGDKMMLELVAFLRPIHQFENIHALKSQIDTDAVNARRILSGHPIIAMTESASDTRALGEKMAQHLLPGDVVVLKGDLGAGKSEFARGIARGLHITGPIPSPSFTILNEYTQGTMPLYHFDWYRVETADELYEIGVTEQLRGEGVSLVEWAERAPELIPDRHLTVWIIPVSEQARQIIIESIGGYPAVSEKLFKEESLC